MYHNQFVLQRLRPSSALKQAFQSSIPLIAATEGTSLATVPFFYALTQKNTRYYCNRHRSEKVPETHSRDERNISVCY
jgi:hypothetical protein